MDTTEQSRVAAYNSDIDPTIHYNTIKMTKSESLLKYCITYKLVEYACVQYVVKCTQPTYHFLITFVRDRFESLYLIGFNNNLLFNKVAT